MLGIIARSEYSLILIYWQTLHMMESNKTEQIDEEQIMKCLKLQGFSYLQRWKKKENLIPNSITYRGDIIVQCCKFTDKHGNI